MSFLLSSDAFCSDLIRAGVIDPNKRYKKITIIAEVSKPVVIIAEEFGGQNVAEVAPALQDAEVEYVAPQ